MAGKPIARHDDLVIDEVGDELVVYDRSSNRVHYLNAPAAFVWRHCDGRRTVPELAALVHQEFASPDDEDLVWLALGTLGRARLLSEEVKPPAGRAPVTRRDVLKRVAQVGGLAVSVPLVQSIVAPTPAMAATCAPVNAGCCTCIQTAGGQCRGCSSTETSAAACATFCLTVLPLVTTPTFTAGRKCVMDGAGGVQNCTCVPC